MKVGSELGVKGVVVHLGYQKTLTREEDLSKYGRYVVKVVEKFLEFQEKSESNTVKNSTIKLILETPAGAGSQLVLLQMI